MSLKRHKHKVYQSIASIRFILVILRLYTANRHTMAISAAELSDTCIQEVTDSWKRDKSLRAAHFVINNLQWTACCHCKTLNLTSLHCILGTLYLLTLGHTFIVVDWESSCRVLLELSNQVDLDLKLAKTASLNVKVTTACILHITISTPYLCVNGKECYKRHTVPPIVSCFDIVTASGGRRSITLGDDWKDV